MKPKPPKPFEDGRYCSPYCTVTVSQIARRDRTAFCTITHNGHSQRVEIRRVKAACYATEVLSFTGHDGLYYIVTACNRMTGRD